MKTVSILQNMLLAFELILKRLDDLDAKVSGLPQVYVACDGKLFRTLEALRRLGGEASASMVSDFTGRARAVESHYLTVLSGMGVVCKRRVGRRVVYSLTEAGFKVFRSEVSRV